MHLLQLEDHEAILGQQVERYERTVEPVAQHPYRRGNCSFVIKGHFDPAVHIVPA